MPGRPERKRFEIRSPDATCNPYLAFAAILMAGLDGVERELDPVELGYGPYDVNLYNLPIEEQRKIRSLPRTAGRGARRFGGGPRVFAQRRRLSQGADRDVDRAQAGRGPADQPRAAPSGVRLLLRFVTTLWRLVCGQVSAGHVSVGHGSVRRVSVRHVSVCGWSVVGVIGQVLIWNRSVDGLSSSGCRSSAGLLTASRRYDGLLTACSRYDGL